MAIIIRCVKCGERYQASQEHKCKPRRRPRVPYGATPKELPPTPTADVPPGLDERKSVVDGKCPTCGQQIGPMTSAERQRRYRERKNKDA